MWRLTLVLGFLFAPELCSGTDASPSTPPNTTPPPIRIPLENDGRSTIPWPLIVTGLVSALGIGGTLGATILSNRAADRRRMADQKDNARTLFHQERLNMYAALITKAHALSHASQKCQPWSRTRDLLENNYEISESKKALQLAMDHAHVAMEDAGECVLIVGSEKVRTAAKLVLVYGRGFTQGEMDIDPFFDNHGKLSEACAIFSNAARDELLPPEANA